MIRLMPCLVIFVPGVAMAHAVERGLILLLPTQYYVLGGGLAIGVSFLVLAVSPRHRPWTASGLSIALPISLAPLLQWIGFAAFCGLIASGFLGARDPLTNPLPLVVWTCVWIGLMALVALVGDIWPAINPWSAPARTIRRLAGMSPAPIPDWVGHWPAVVGLGMVVWFQIADVAPEDPTRLARATLIYWFFHAIGTVAFGEPWRQRCEALSMLFHLTGRIAPLRISARIDVTWPGQRLLDRAGLPLTGWLFVTMAIAAVTFDGLAGTFWWLGLNGVNPLEYPGRSAVWAQNTAGLIGTWIVMTMVYAGAIALGWLLAGRRVLLAKSLGLIALSLLPIALAYHLSHYLTVLLVNGQYVLLVLNDPMATGADWLGLGAYPVTTSFLNNLEDVRLIWNVQTALIVGGHLMAVGVAHAIALQLYSDRRTAVLSQVPLAVLMIGYTVLGLWLLSTPTAV